MKSLLQGIRVFEEFGSQVEAHPFNRLRLAQLRLGNNQPLRLSLKKLYQIEMILDRDAWICIDSAFYDMPLLAWTDFEDDDRDSLIKPVKCQVLHYQAHALLLQDKILSMTVDQVEQMLREQ